MLDRNEVISFFESGLKDVYSAANLESYSATTAKTEEDEIIESQSEEKNNVIYLACAKSKDGAVRISWNLDLKDFALEFSNDSEAQNDTFERASLWRLDEAVADQRDMKSMLNDFEDAIKDRFVKKVKVSPDGVKMPIPVSRSDVKNSGANFDSITLATRFATIYPEYKEKIKENIASFGGTFLPEEFFTNQAAPKALEVIKSGRNNEIKKLVGLFNEMYDDGSSEVQEIICVTILGQLGNDSELLSKIDEYMDDSLKASVHNVNRYLNKGLGKKKKAILESK